MFSFGKNKSVQNASSQQTASSLSTSESSSRGTSQATSGGYQGSTQEVAFGDYFASLFGGASNAAVDSVANAPLFAEESAQLFSGGAKFLDTLQNLPGMQYMKERISGFDQAAENQISVLGDKLGKFFDEKLMPGITGRGVSTGTLGGSRGAVATGTAAGGVSDAYSAGVASILSSSQAQKDALAGTANQNAVGAAGTGLASLPALQGVSSAGANAAMNPYLMLAQILGPQNNLTTSYGEQAAQSSSEDVAEAISRAISESQGTSVSTGQSGGFNFGVGAMAGSGAN